MLGENIVAEMGMRTRPSGDTLRGEAHLVPELCVPGTDVLRTSVLATWADVLTGLLSAHTIAPSVPLTLDLEVQVHRHPTSGQELHGTATIVKAGRTVVVSEVRFHEPGHPTPVAVAHASFVASPKPEHVAPEGGFERTMPGVRPLALPLAERAGAAVLGPGCAEVPRRDDGVNASGGIQGGLLALAAELAATSHTDRPLALSSLGLRYLRPFSVGPARAEAEAFGDLCVVRVTDAGRGVLGALATARTAPLGG